MTTALERYGRDVFCDTEVRSGRYAAGVLVVAQNAAHRLTTPRGMLRGGEEEANYGLDLPGMIGGIATASQAASMPGRINAELRKDRRIAAVRVRATTTTDDDGDAHYAYDIECSTADGLFSLTASEVTVAVVGLGRPS